MLNNPIPANTPIKLSSPVATLAIVSPAFTGLLTSFAYNPAIALANTSLALSTSA